MSVSPSVPTCLSMADTLIVLTEIFSYLPTREFITLTSEVSRGLSDFRWMRRAWESIDTSEIPYNHLISTVMPQINDYVPGVIKHVKVLYKQVWGAQWNFQCHVTHKDTFMASNSNAPLELHLKNRKVPSLARGQPHSANFDYLSAPWSYDRQAS
jgi:hypothetical protein